MCILAATQLAVIDGKVVGLQAEPAIEFAVEVSFEINSVTVRLI